MGALTAKPLAFNGRPWEYDSIFSVDLYDTFGANIIINRRGTEILRVIPRNHIQLNKYMITDKVRFSFDMLKYQRILKPQLNVTKVVTKTKKLITSSFLDIIPLMSLVFVGTKRLYVSVGNFLNLKQLTYFYNNIITSFTTNNLIILNSYAKVYQTKLWNSFIYTASLTTFKQYKTIYLINTNVTKEIPNLIYYLQQYLNFDFNNKIFNIGVQTNLFLKHTYLGQTVKVISQLIAGKSKLLKKEIKNPILFIVGVQNLNQLSLVLTCIKQLQQNGYIINILGTWQNPVDLALTLSNYYTPTIITRLYLNEKNDKTTNSILILNTELNYNKQQKGLTIFAGSHANSNIFNYDIILPLKHYFEEHGLFINFQGKYQVATRAIDNTEFLYNFYDIFYHVHYQYFIFLKKNQNKNHTMKY